MKSVFPNLKPTNYTVHVVKPKAVETGGLVFRTETPHLEGHVCISCGGPVASGYKVSSELETSVAINRYSPNRKDLKRVSRTPTLANVTKHRPPGNASESVDLAPDAILSILGGVDNKSSGESRGSG